MGRWREAISNLTGLLGTDTDEFTAISTDTDGSYASNGFSQVREAGQRVGVRYDASKPFSLKPAVTSTMQSLKQAGVQANAYFIDKNSQEPIGVDQDIIYIQPLYVE